ncbi:MAG: hypothetical protein HC880_01515 [Bacteroidia bacterium]|nr:hypothetical protein [Bacteroidia bacterium]
MKKFLLLLCLVWGVEQAKAQSSCDIQTYKEICIRKIPEYFVFTKSYALTQRESEHEIIFNGSNAYIFIADSYRTVIEVYRQGTDGEKILIKSGKAYLSYIPSNTGKYYVRFVFEDTDEFCGAAVMCFLR